MSMQFDLITLTAALLCIATALVIFLFNKDILWAHSPWNGKLKASRRLEDLDFFKLSGVPRPKPLPDFDVNNAKPRPYRPFRWQYHQTMSLMAMEPDWWLELECTYLERINQRKELYAKHGKTVVDSMQNSALACKELMHMTIQFLCTRYPGNFYFEQKSSVFVNRILDSRTNINAIDPLVFLLNNVPEDFLIVEEDEDIYYLRAGVSCSAVGWNMATKMGKPLHAIHEPVPFYKEKLESSMNRYFSKMPCNKPIQRGSWGIEIGQPLFLQSNDPHFLERSVQSPNLNIQDIFLRVDWQTLRRLPLSRAIVFNFKAFFTPISQFRTESHIPRLLLRILRDGPDAMMKYKGTFHVEHKVIPTLAAWAKEQEDSGWVPSGWEGRTLDDHPFFPGWDVDS